MAEDKNIEALMSFRLGGKPVQKGTVIPKTAFKRKGDWQNLCHMGPKPRAAETSKPVAKAKAGLPGAGAE